jgi:hypothetical protein
MAARWGISPFLRQMHDLVYCISCSTSAVAGNRAPCGLTENTTSDLVADMEKLRQHLGM